MCELAHSIGSDADSGSSVGDWEHNIWNPLLDMLAEYRTGPVLRFLQDEEAGPIGITSHFALDVMSRAVGEKRCDPRCDSTGANGEFEGDLGSAWRWNGSRMVSVGRI